MYKFPIHLLSMGLQPPATRSYTMRLLSQMEARLLMEYSPSQSA